jgi:hypothetical protein
LVSQVALKPVAAQSDTCVEQPVMDAAAHGVRRGFAEKDAARTAPVQVTLPLPPLYWLLPPPTGFAEKDAARTAPVQVTLPLPPLYWLLPPPTNSDGKRCESKRVWHGATENGP